MCSNIFSCTNATYIEADSKLSAMATFLDQLEGDPAAPSLLLTLVHQLRSIIYDGVEESTGEAIEDVAMRRAVQALHATIAELDEGRIPSSRHWQRLRNDHQRCRKTFSGYARRQCTCGDSPKTTFDIAA